MNHETEINSQIHQKAQQILSTGMIFTPIILLKECVFLCSMVLNFLKTCPENTHTEDESDEKEYTDISVLDELNEIANTKDEDLEAVLEEGYDHFDEDYTNVKYRDSQVPQPSAGIAAQERKIFRQSFLLNGIWFFAQKNLPKNLDWSDWHRDREEIIQQQLEEREATVSRRNRSHFNYSFIGTSNEPAFSWCKYFSYICRVGGGALTDLLTVVLRRFGHSFIIHYCQLGELLQK